MHLKQPIIHLTYFITSQALIIIHLNMLHHKNHITSKHTFRYISLHHLSMASHIISNKVTTYESLNQSKDIGSKHIISSLKALHVHFGNTQPNKHVNLYSSKQDHITNTWTLQMHDLPLLTLQQLSTYGIMHKHVNEFSYHWINKTLILTCETNQAIKHVKHRLWKHKNIKQEAKQNKHVKIEAKQIK